jgi:C-terminal processing protease CtpA/Prc
MYYKANTPLEEREYDYFTFIKTPPEFGVIDFWFKRNEGIVIDSMLKDSIAHTVFGLNPGDIITHINGKPVFAYPGSELFDPKFYLNVEE